MPNDPLSGPPDNWRAAVADPSIAPPPVSRTSPLIALLDTRLDEHPPRVGRLATSTTLGGLPLDNLHGTATASVAAAPANGVGIVGVWPGARALNIPLPADALTLLGLGQGRQQGDRGGRGRDQHELRLGLAVRRRVRRAPARRAPGIMPVAAAGNEFEQGNPLEFPASLPHVLTVGAVDADRRRVGFSNAQRRASTSARRA